MSRFRSRIDRGFEGLARFLYRRAWLVVLVLALAMASVVWHLPQLVLDTSNEGLLHTDDPIIERYNEFRRQFGRDALIIVAVKAPKSVFNLDFLNKLRALQRDLEAETPHLNEITSLVNARDTRGEGDKLVVGQFMADWPRSQAEADVLEKRARDNRLYVDQLFSADGKLADIVITLDNYTSAKKSEADDDSALTGLGSLAAKGRSGVLDAQFLSNDEQQEAVRAVREIVARHQAQGLEISLAGPPVVGEVLEHVMLGDIYTSVVLVLTITALCLLVMFRRLSGVILPLVVVNLALTTTLGIMAWLGVPVKLPSMVLPAFLLAVGVGASVHVLALFFRRYHDRSDKEAALVYALGRAGLAVVMTSLTTAAGLFSFITAAVAPIADMGLFSGIGVLLSLVYTLTLLPALMALVPIKPREPRPGRVPRVDRFLAWLAGFTVRRAKPIVWVSLVLVGLSLIGVSRTGFSHNVLKWLPPDLPVRRATELIDSRLKGSVSVEVVVDTGRENGVQDRAILTGLDRLTSVLETTSHGDLKIGKGSSVADVVKEINQALNDNRLDAYRIPANQALIPQELLLFSGSGSDDLEKLVDPDYRRARFTGRAPWGDSMLYAPFLEVIGDIFKRELGPGVEVTVTGAMTLFYRTIAASIRSMAVSYSVALVAITLMMIALIGKLRIGLAAMLPNLAPILMTLGFMGWLDLPLDMITMLTGSIAIGLAVDDTVHFMHHFRRGYDESGSAPQAVKLALETAGRAMIVTTVVLSLGFFVMATATLKSIAHFGILTGVTVLLALLADLFLAPALMTVIYGRGSR